MSGKSKVVLNGGKGNNDLLSETHQRINGNEGDDNIVGTGLNDFIHGNEGNDVIEGGEGDDKIYGNEGIDTAVYSGSIFDYIWERGKGNSLVVTDTNADDGDNGVDTLKHIEYMSFDDFTYSTTGNNAALVLGDNQATDEDTALSFSISAFDFDGDETSISSITSSSGATVSVSESTNLSPAIGSGKEFSIDYDPGSLFQHLAVGESVTDSITIEVSDGNGGLTEKVTEITITGVNDDPDAVDDAATVAEDSTGIIIDLLGNDTDIDASDILSISGFDTSGLSGTIVDNGDGTVTYNPDGAFDSLLSGESDVDSFTYSISDGNGGVDTATVNVTVEGKDNLGFEEGTFAGWDTIGNTTIETGAAPEGTYFAALRTAGGVGQSSLETFLGTGPTSIEDITMGGPTDGSAIKTTISVDAGDTIEFNWRFDTSDYDPYFDNSFYTSLDGDLIQLADVSDVGDFGDSGWMTASITVTTGGTYDFGFGVVDEGDSAVNSTLYIDDLSIV